MSLEYSEHAKWVKLKRQPMTDYGLKVNETLSESAARGFYQPPASTIEAIINIGQIAKVDITNKNGELYKEQKDIVFQIEEFALKLTLEYAKLELAIYKQGILDALAIERAQMEYDFTVKRADILRLKAENNARSVVLIRAKAEQDAEITDYKIRQEEAKRLGLAKELELLAAQRETAIERLKIIDALKLVIAAEGMVIEAERRKAEALELVIAAEKILLGVKEAMIPLYQNLADHKKSLATAIIDEVAVKEKIIKLGYDRIGVKQAEAAAFVTQTASELGVEYARTEYIRATNANAEARSKGAADFAETKNNATDIVIDLKNVLNKSIVDLRLETQLAKFLRNIESKIEIQQEETQAIAEKLTAQLASMTAIAESQSARIQACAHTTTRTTMCKQIHNYVNSD